ncbi:thrombospondin type 3 repeat-containing protein [Polyangium spumosum]|nr:thrombospondin type 3 repeat-containing protein [Polyangium spumosum]
MIRKTGFNYATGFFAAMILAGCVDLGSHDDVETSQDHLIAPPTLPPPTCPDRDLDGICDIGDNCPDHENPDQKDTDGDGLGDACDWACPDADSNGICDADECPDIDGDEVCDLDDNCPHWGNWDQKDTDGDGLGDACDSNCDDIDGDKICDADDNCPHWGNADQTDTDGDGLGDACDTASTTTPPPPPPPPPVPPPPPPCADLDDDGVCDIDDNCPEHPNAGQIDGDGDGYGDPCDCIDRDLDSICDQDDVCKYTHVPELYVPAVTLWYNRYALVDGDDVFDTGGMKGQPAPRIYTLQDTRGCSCEQIIEALGLGQGMINHGCSITTMEYWISQVNKAP